MEKNLQDEIAEVAFELHKRKGTVHGRALDDWLEAERIVLARYEKSADKEKPKNPSRSASRKKK
ncbi:MAG TPA: DUF2934 domain-containing protein [Nitrospirota bacterium]|nr:DUF2934 domain-containing protein [Nitrospirota bacterium]